MKRTILTAMIISMAFLNACKKEDASKKTFSLEMKINGVLWVAAKNQSGIYSTSVKSLSFTGQRGDDIFNFAKDTVTGVGTYAMPSGNIALILGSGSSQKQYNLNSSKPKSRGSVSFLNSSPNQTGLPSLASIEYPEVNFSAVLFDAFNVDSVVITEGKLRYQ